MFLKYYKVGKNIFLVQFLQFDHVLISAEIFPVLGRVLHVLKHLPHRGEEGGRLLDVLLAQLVLLNEPGVVLLGEFSVADEDDPEGHFNSHIFYSSQHVLKSTFQKYRKLILMKRKY